MDPETLELLRVLQSGAHSKQAFGRIQALLATQRSRLAAADDRATLADLSELLEVWAEGATPAMAASALISAAQIAEEHLEQAERAVQLYLVSLEHEPGDLSALDKVEALLGRAKDGDRLESVLSMQAQSLRVREGVEPTLVASVYRKLGRLRAERGDHASSIEAYEQALDLSPDTDVIRDLADAYAKRGGELDRTQAADLYCTLGDVTGAPEGAAWLERALDEVPGHDAALDLLESFVPAEQHATRLMKRWQAYIEHSEDEASTDKRRMLLAQTHAAHGAAREALICLGPLIERSDAGALALQTECLASLRADEQRDSANDPKARESNRPIKPPTLVGFRVPPADPQPFETSEAPEPVSETRPRPEVQSAPASEPKPAAAPMAKAEAPAAVPVTTIASAVAPAVAAAMGAWPAQKRPPRPRSGETLVGFRVPPELSDAERSAREAEAEADAEMALEAAAAELAAAKLEKAQSESVESSRVVLRANAPAQSVPTARASGAGDARPASRSGSSTAAPNRAHARTLMGVAPSGPAAAAAALKAAAVARASSAPPPNRSSSVPPAAASAASKAAELRAAALRATMPADVVAVEPSVAHVSDGTAPALGGDTSYAAPAAARLSRSRPSSAPPPLRLSSSNGTAPALGGGASSVPPMQAAAAVAPAMPVEEAASPSAPADAADAEAQAVPSLSQPPLPVSVPVLSRPAESALLRMGETSNRRWWIASGVATLVLIGAVVLIARGGSKPPAPLAASSRVESAPPLPVPVVVPSATTPTTTPAPTTTTTTTPPTTVEAHPSSAPAAVPATAIAPSAPPSHHAAERAAPEVKTIDKQLKLHGAGLSNKDVLGALDDSIDKIERCYGRILDKNPHAQGQITLGFTIDKSGKATHVKKTAATLKDAAVQRCATDAIGKAQFPKPSKKKPVQVSAALSFKNR